jgi:hypothetical protein
LSLFGTVAAGIAARADEDDAFGSPEAQHLGLVCLIMVSAWLLFACWRAIRTKTGQGSAWEKQQNLPAWLNRLLDRLQTSRPTRGGARNSVVKGKSISQQYWRTP